MSANNEASRIGGYVAAFAIGALVGTGVALLYAPRSGRETRELLAQKGRELKGQAEDVVDHAKEFVHSKRAELIVAVEAGKDAMREERAKHTQAA
jgi:gas vesicle protein